MSDYTPKNYVQEPAQTRPIKHRQALSLRKAVEEAIKRGVPYEVIESNNAEGMEAARESMKKSARVNVL